MSDGYNIDHQTFFLSGAELDHTLVERERVGADDRRDGVYSQLFYNKIEGSRNRYRYIVPTVIAYSSKARTARVTFLHLVKLQCRHFLSNQILYYYIPSYPNTSAYPI